MNLDKYVAVSGWPGLYEMAANRSNGLIVTDLETKKSRFASVRKHQFTPLGSVAIYTYADSIPIADIFKAMIAKKDTLEIPTGKESKDVLNNYFSEIVPDFDKDRVYPSDIKKVIKWYHFLNERNLLTEEAQEDSKSDEEE